MDAIAGRFLLFGARSFATMDKIDLLEWRNRRAADDAIGCVTAERRSVACLPTL